MKTQENATETAQCTPQTEQTPIEQSATTPQPQETAPQASESPSETPQTQSRRRELSFEQKDFICKHIAAYREQLNHDIANRFPLANKYERLRRLEAMFNEALQPRLKRLFWYPLRRRKDDKIAHRKVKVYERDLSSAVRILSLIVKELDPESIEALDDPFMVQRSYDHPQQFREQLNALEKQDPDASRDLDKAFGLI